MAHGAKNYVDDMETPAIIVNELFCGADTHGGVSLHMNNGTEGNFKNIAVSYSD